MKTIGLIGGMSWESTLPYYRQVNQTVKEHLGGLHSAKVVLVSVDFHDIEKLQRAGDWDAAGALLADAARSHKVAPAIEAAAGIPLFHIADPTAAAIKAAGHTTIGLLGTRFTMEQAFYKDRLRESHGLDVIVPEPAERDIVHRVIYEELCLGDVVDASRDEYRRVIAALVERGAQAIILGCTEISLLIAQSDAAVPLFDTTAIHARKAAEFALGLPLDVQLDTTEKK
jgi:aspartate racemase